ncbi:hypothetical protein GCM10023336_13730 [Streptomyces similanensis]|uniref:Uncharacterized protein n=1 Tax=Streptomyces similanensis TaxID=1274988 RepID=A0ABP9JZ35_9ACTN
MRHGAARERLDHLGQQPPVPGEQLLMAGDVVQVQHRRVVQRRGQASGERGLPGAGVPVDADETDRTAGRRKAAELGGEGVDGGSRSASAAAGI